MSKLKNKYEDGRIVRWIADEHTRRVPTFVIRMTRLKTKKRIEEVFGKGAVFEVGKMAPPKLSEASKPLPRATKPARKTKAAKSTVKAPETQAAAAAA